MLTRILTSLALTVGLIHPSIASESIKLPTELICGSEKGFEAVLEKYGEIPFATMTSSREIPGIGFSINPMVIFVNPQTKTYTIVEQLADNVYCVVALGEAIAPYIEEK